MANKAPELNIIVVIIPIIEANKAMPMPSNITCDYEKKIPSFISPHHCIAFQICDSIHDIHKNKK